VIGATVEVSLAVVFRDSGLWKIGMSKHGQHYASALRTKKRKGRKKGPSRSSARAMTRNKSGKKRRKKKRTPCSTPCTRVSGEIPCVLKRTTAPHARICCPCAHGVDVQVERERAHAAEQLVAPPSRTSQQPIRTRSLQHRQRSLLSLRSRRCFREKQSCVTQRVGFVEYVCGREENGENALPLRVHP